MCEQQDEYFFFMSKKNKYLTADYMDGQLYVRNFTNFGQNTLVSDQFVRLCCATIEDAFQFQV